MVEELGVFVAIGVGTLLDCHSNWTAAHFLMEKNGKDAPDCTVTANYAVELLRPTPADADIFLRRGSLIRPKTVRPSKLN